MIRLVAQQSNCFLITSVGNLRMENRISGITQYQRNSGEFRAGSNQQMGQRVAADYFLEPAILFAGDTTSGLAGGLGGLGCMPRMLTFAHSTACFMYCSPAALARSCASLIQSSISRSWCSRKGCT